MLYLQFDVKYMKQVWKKNDNECGEQFSLRKKNRYHTKTIITLIYTPSRNQFSSLGDGGGGK